MSLFHSMCVNNIYKVMIIWIMYDVCMNYMKPSDKSIDNTQVYNCGQLVAPLWWLNWPPRTISSGSLGRPQRWPLLPLSSTNISTNISTTQEVSQIGKWAADGVTCTFPPSHLCCCCFASLVARPPLLSSALSPCHLYSPCHQPPAWPQHPCQTSPLLIEILFASLTGWHPVHSVSTTTHLPLTQTEHSLLHYHHAKPRNKFL